MRPEEQELDALMARLAQGDRDAFDPLFRALHPRALRLARARLGDDRAADAAQGAMLKVFANASDFRAGAPVLPWFYAIAANEIRSVARAGGPLRARTEDAPEAVTTDDPEKALVLRELAAALDHAVAELDPQSAEAIAAMLGEGPRPAIEAVTFRKRLSRAYARLRLRLGGSHET